MGLHEMYTVANDIEAQKKLRGKRVLVLDYIDGSRSKLERHGAVVAIVAIVKDDGGLRGRHEVDPAHLVPENFGGGKKRHAKSPARKHRHREHRALVKSGWLPKSKLAEYNPDRYDFRWNADYTMFQPKKLLWWDDASYARYQSEDWGDMGGKKRHAGGKARHSKWKRKETRAAIREYNRLLDVQRKMPESEMWHMGEALRQAKAKAYVEMEYERAFPGGKRRHGPATGVAAAEKALRRALKD